MTLVKLHVVNTLKSATHNVSTQVRSYALALAHPDIAMLQIVPFLLSHTVLGTNIVQCSETHLSHRLIEVPLLPSGSAVCLLC